MFTLSSLLLTLFLHLGGRAFGPPLCRGCAPATPPYKTIPHRPCVLIPAVRLQQRGCRQPNTQSDCQNCGSDKELVKTGTVYGLVVTVAAIRAALRGQRCRSCSSPRLSEAVLDAPKKTASVNEHRAQTAALRSLAYVDESDETRGMMPEDHYPESAAIIAETLGKA